MSLASRFRLKQGFNPAGAPFKPSFDLRGVVPDHQITRSFDHLILFLWLIFFTTVCAADIKANIPDWVRQTAAQKLPPYPPDTDAVVLLNENNNTLTSPDESVEHIRRVVRILRPEGRRQAFLHVQVPHEGKLISVHGWSIDAAGHEYELKDKDFVGVGVTQSFELYSDLIFRVAEAPGAGPGSVVAIESEVKRRLYYTHLMWWAQEEIPVISTTFSVDMPSGWEFKDGWTGMDAVKPTQIGPNRWQWNKTNLPGIDDEPDRPDTAALATRLTVLLFPTPSQQKSTDWNSVALRDADLIRDRRTTSPELIARVTELTAGKNTFDEKVRALTAFMQREIRYVAIEVGIGGFQPHPAADVFHNRYGDCKDKSILLGTMLRQIGVNSVYLPIHSERGVVRPEMPGSWFNHVIIAIELPADTASDRYSAMVTNKSGKSFVIFDPTDEWTPFGEVRPSEQDSYALMVTDDGGELIHIPIAPPLTNGVVRSATLKLTSEGSLSGTVDEKLTGNFARIARAFAEHNNQQQELQRYENQIAYSLKNASVQGLALDGLKDFTKPVDVRFSITADRYAQIMGPLLIVRPRVLGVKTISLERKARKYPLVVGGTALETDDFELQIPAGYAVDDKPDPVSVDTPFASYKSHIEVNGDKLHYSREYVMKSLEIPADKIEDLRAFENKVAADENAAVVFKKVAQAAGQD